MRLNRVEVFVELEPREAPTFRGAYRSEAIRAEGVALTFVAPGMHWMNGYRQANVTGMCLEKDGTPGPGWAVHSAGYEGVTPWPEWLVKLADRLQPDWEAVNPPGAVGEFSSREERYNRRDTSATEGGPEMAARSEASERIAAALAREMAKRGLTRADVLDRIEQNTGQRPGRMWASRTFSGGSHFTVQVPSEVPNDLLAELARAIDPEHSVDLARRLGRLATRKPKANPAV